jgi:hypothetical protein
MSQLRLGQGIIPEMIDARTTAGTEALNLATAAFAITVSEDG